MRREGKPRLRKRKPDPGKRQKLGHPGGDGRGTGGGWEKLELRVRERKTGSCGAEGKWLGSVGSLRKGRGAYHLGDVNDLARSSVSQTVGLDPLGGSGSTSGSHN